MDFIYDCCEEIQVYLEWHDTRGHETQGNQTTPYTETKRTYEMVHRKLLTALRDYPRLFRWLWHNLSRSYRTLTKLHTY